jgi:hypothetical protein
LRVGFVFENVIVSRIQKRLWTKGIDRYFCQVDMVILLRGLVMPDTRTNRSYFLRKLTWNCRVYHFTKSFRPRINSSSKSQELANTG